MKKKVVLVGFSATGKTSVGRHLETSAGWKWVDVDALVEKQAGRTITDIIRVEGESRFRELESEALRQACEAYEACEEALESNFAVVSLGGGALLDSRNVKLVKQWGELFCLTASPEVIAERVVAEKSSKKRPLRPLLGDGEDVLAQVKELLAKRRTAYDAARKVIWTDWASIEELADLVSREAGRTRISSGPTKGKTRAIKSYFIPVRFNGFQTEVVVGSGVAQELGSRIRERFPDASLLVVVADELVNGVLGKELKKRLIADGWQIKIEIVPSGESAKTLSVVEKLSGRLLEFGFTRGDVVVGFGGGAACDVSSFLASVFMRGVGNVLLPTTLLSQVDAAIGGKTAVNLGGEGSRASDVARITGKNTLGTFYPATLVVSDLDNLSSLPEREFNSGFAEVVKYGLIGSFEFFSWLEKSAERIVEKDDDALTELVDFCSREKIRFVRGDLRDLSGRRALLNFGHTVGHALESLTEYKSLLHGEAVSIGMVQALLLGEDLGRTANGLCKRTGNLLRKFGLPVELPDALTRDADVWEKALRADKKRTTQAVRFVLVNEPGYAELFSLPISEVVKSIAKGSEAFGGS